MGCIRMRMTARSSAESAVMPMQRRTERSIAVVTGFGVLARRPGERGRNKSSSRNVVMIVGIAVVMVMIRNSVVTY